jgi:predicted MPP superfamily phosphohydrolase
VPNRRRHRALIFLLIFIVVYFGVMAYPAIRILTLALPSWQPGTPALLAIFVLPLLPRLAQTRWNNRFTRAASALAFTWLGLCFQLFPLVLAFEIVNALVGLPAQPSGFALAGTALLLAIAGFIVARRLHLRTIALPAPAALAGKSLVQITDVHLGSRPAALLERIVRRIEAVAPDYVVITGDLVDEHGIDAAWFAPLKRIEAPIYYVIGNHERYVDLDAIIEGLAQTGVEVLRGRAVRDGPITFIGIDDAEAKDTVAHGLAALEAGGEYRVLLYHRPRGFEDAARAGIDLMLSGHTHDGQIVPFNWIVRRVFPRSRGLFRIGASRLYVSPGTGTWGPMLRLGSRSEITRFVFEEAAPAGD